MLGAISTARKSRLSFGRFCVAGLGFFAGVFPGCPRQNLPSSPVSPVSLSIMAFWRST
jgi:hypothetical protein